MTSVEALQADLAVRYYRFAVEDWSAELAGDLGRLRRFKSGFSVRALSAFAGLGAEQRADLAVALLHRGHPLAVSKLGLELTPRQAEMLERWDASRSLGGGLSRFGGATPRKPRIAREVKARLKALGEPEPFGGRLTWRYRARHRGFTVFTYVDVGGRVSDLSYEHDVLFGEVPIQRRISYLAWLGIGASKWSLQTDGDLAEAAELLEELCSRFLGSLTTVLPEG